MRLLRNLCIILSLAASAHSQPRLDRVKVDELTHQIVLYGYFPTGDSYSVFCDSIRLLGPDSVSSTELRATIPDSGRGSCGQVWAISVEGESNRRLLTYWSFHNFYSFVHNYSDGGNEHEGALDTVFLRCDYSLAKSFGTFAVLPVQISYFAKMAGGNDGLRYKYTGPQYGFGGVIRDSMFFSSSGGAVNDGTVGKLLYLDDALNIRPYNDGTNCGQFGFSRCDFGGPLGPVLFAPTMSTVAIAPGVRITYVRNGDKIVFMGVPHDGCQSKIVNVLGEKIAVSVVSDNGELDISRLSRGAYFLLLFNGATYTTFKLLK